MSACLPVCVYMSIYLSPSLSLSLYVSFFGTVYLTLSFFLSELYIGLCLSFFCLPLPPSLPLSSYVPPLSLFLLPLHLSLPPLSLSPSLCLPLPRLYTKPSGSIIVEPLAVIYGLNHLFGQIRLKVAALCHVR